MIQADKAVLAVIDIQGRLATLMHERERLFDNASRLIRGSKALDLPMVWTEQNPAGLGPTTPEIAKLLPGEPIPKMAFGCGGEPAFLRALEATGRRQVLLCGIEAHICIYQTAVGLIEAGYEPHVVTDAVSSRTAANRELGLARMKDAGAVLTGVEMALFEMLGTAEATAFREVVRIVK